jgi:hypothetical protein
MCLVLGAILKKIEINHQLIAELLSSSISGMLGERHRVRGRYLAAGRGDMR